MTFRLLNIELLVLLYFLLSLYVVGNTRSYPSSVRAVAFYMVFRNIKGDRDFKMRESEKYSEN